MKMKNVSSLKSNITNSPKTPGGISKSLLTPCRRVGLSRNWRNKGPSPFISPLATSTEVQEEKPVTRKRKECILEDNVEKTPESTVEENDKLDDISTDINKTPARNVEVPRRKKSKTLLLAINKSEVDTNTQPSATDEIRLKEVIENSSVRKDIQNTENIEVVSTPVRSKSKKGKKRSPALKCRSAKINLNKSDECNEVNIYNTDQTPKEPTETLYTVKEKSPNDLRKECIVVIQRKIFKKVDNPEVVPQGIKGDTDNNQKSSLQALFDSDSDEVPLIQLNNKDTTKPTLENVHKHTTTKLETKKYSNEDDDFIDKSTKIHVNTVKETKSPKNKLKINKNIKMKEEAVKVQPKPSSQSSFDEDDDDFDNKKTILIRKTYEKVTMPLKAKSTGSITQKDIDELKARIEAKKKLLLAKSITPDTEELRTLIKKWQKGCQDALMELLELMKTKFHDKQDMDYSEMLKTLKIPPSLVGYDSENDCFNSPDDASVILGPFNNIG